VYSARLAVRSLDVQTYIWHADLTGMYLAQQLIDAADRGVKVRLLVDDMDARAKNAGFAALAAHSNIDVRLFNPFASRTGMLGLIGEGLSNFGRVNRRMHNKSWIADNRIALVGGRNIGDEYYGASDGVNFVDLDAESARWCAMHGLFDKYWNSALIESLDAASVSATELDRLRALLSSHAQDAANSRYATELRAGDSEAPRRGRLAGAMVVDVHVRLGRSAEGDDDGTERSAHSCRSGITAVGQVGADGYHGYLTVFRTRRDGYRCNGYGGRGGQARARVDELARRQRCRCCARRILASSQASARRRRESVRT
jgi:hypothetical protein